MTLDERTGALGRMLLAAPWKAPADPGRSTEVVALGPIGSGYAHHFVVGSPFRLDDVFVIGQFPLASYEVRVLVLSEDGGSRRVEAALLTDGEEPDAWVPESEFSDSPLTIDDDGLISFSTITELDKIEKKGLRDALLRPFSSPDLATVAPLWLDLTKRAKIDAVVVFVGKGRASYPVHVGARGRSPCAVLIDFLVPIRAR